MVYNCRQVIRLAEVVALGIEGGKKKCWISAASSRPVWPSGKSSLCSPTLSTPLRRGGGGVGVKGGVFARGNAIAKIRCYTQY